MKVLGLLFLNCVVILGSSSAVVFLLFSHCSCYSVCTCERIVCQFVYNINLTGLKWKLTIG